MLPPCDCLLNCRVYWEVMSDSKFMENEKALKKCLVNFLNLGRQSYTQMDIEG